MSEQKSIAELEKELEYSRIKVGDFFLREGIAEGSIWIGVNETGEGGDFDRELFGKHIESFYNEYF